MKEIGGYIELDTYNLPMLHNDAIALNCGRNCLAYLIETKNIQKIFLPKFLCKSVADVCKKYNVEIRYYSIDYDFLPKDFVLLKDEWLYLVNYYGQIDNKIISLFREKYKNIIVDNSQAYFQMPVDNIDTIYTCRKFLGVSDGAFLYSDRLISRHLPQDESFERIHYVLGRYERGASEFYQESSDNNKYFINEPIKYMSKLTKNLLHAIDYNFVRDRRTENFNILHHEFKYVNKLKLSVPDGAFMYPLYIDNGAVIRKELQKKKIYVPTLWPDVFNSCNENELEYDMAKNILPLPVDQRYDRNNMINIINEVSRCIKI